MENDIWKLLDKSFSEFPLRRATSCSLEEIEDAEYKLGIKFHIKYKKFLLVYGGACVGSKFVYGLHFQKDMDVKLNNVISVTNFYRAQKWPDIEDWYIVSDDFDGNPIGVKSNGEVWLSDHNSDFEQIKIADNFEEFLYKLHTDTLFG